MAQKVRITSYMRNVGRSFGYVVKDVVGDYAPTMKSIVSDSKSTYQDIKFSMQEIKNNNISNATKSFGSGPNILSNTLDDLKTGKWYNKEREDDAFGFDFDIGDFGSDEDWGDDDFDDDDTGAVMQNDNMNTREVISSMGQVSTAISKSVGYASARSAEYIVANNNAASRALYDLNAKGFNQVSSILMNMSDTMVGIASLGEPLAAHMQNSSVFYMKTTETLNTMNENLAILVKRTEYMENTASKEAKAPKNGYDRFMSGGKFDFGSYIEMVKENTKEQTDTIKSLYEMAEMMFGKNGKNTSLTQLLLKGGIDKLIPQITKDITKQLDEALSDALGNGLMRAGKSARSRGGVIGMLADILFPKENIKTGINTANYEKGPMQWDGVARQSLTYVIPTYLAQMTALLAGVNDEQDYQYYDFNRGKFTSKKVYKKEKEARDRLKAREVGGDFETQALKATSSEQMQKEIQEFFYQTMIQGGDFYNIRKGKTDENWRKKYGNISEETVDLLLQIIEDNNKSGPNKNRGNASAWERRANSAIGERSAQTMREEASGMSYMAHMYDGSDAYRYASAVGGTGGRNGRGPRSGYRNTSEKQSINNNRTRAYQYNATENTYTVGANDVVLNADDFKQWLDAFNLNDQETMRKIENTKAMKDAGKKANSMLKDFGKTVVGNFTHDNAKAESLVESLSRVKDVIQTPIYAVTMAMDSLNRGLNKLFWGDHGDDGIIDKLKNKLEDTWQKLSERLGGLTKEGRKKQVRTRFGLPEGTVDIIPDERFNGQVYLCLDANGTMIGSTDAAAASAWYDANRKRDSLKVSMANEWSNIKQKVKDKLTGTDVANLKEQYNAFKESTGFSGSGSGLRISGGASDMSKLKRIGNSDVYTDGKGKYYSKDETGNWAQIDTSSNDGMKKVASSYGKAINGSTPVQTIKSGASTLVNGLGDFFSQVATGKKKEEQEKKDIFGAIQNAFKDAGDNKGAMGIGAITGVGVSLLTGAVVGPLAGAAIGAGIGLATKSEAFQNFLFGEGDPNSDDYKKGVLGEIGKKIKDPETQSILKGTGIGGGIGLIGGTLMGSPILGMVAGSAVGYVSKSTKAQEFLFGTEDQKTALGELKDKIQEHAPNVAAGAIAGLVAGPFGVVGNLLIGGGLGYLSSTDKFHKFMFGDPGGQTDDEKNGLAGQLHDKIIAPIDELIHNISNGITGFLRKLGANILDRMKKLGKSIGDKINDAIKSNPATKKVAEKLEGFAKGIIKAPINLVGGVFNGARTATKKMNLNGGYDVYDERLGRNATAQERLNMRSIIKNGGAIKGEDGKFYKVNVNGTRHEIDEEEYNKIIQKQSNSKVWKANKKSTKIDAAIAGMSKEDIESFKNLDDEDIRAKLSELTNGDVKNMSAGDIKNFKKLLSTEKSTRFSPEKMAEQQQKDEDNYKTNILGVLHNLDYHFNKKRFFKLKGKYKVVATAKAEEDERKEEEQRQEAQIRATEEDILGGADEEPGNGGAPAPKKARLLSRIGGKLSSLFKRKASSEESDEVSESGSGSAMYKKIMRNLSAGGDEDKKTEFTNNGPVQYVKNSQGEWIIDRSDTETKNTMKKQNAFNESISGIGKISTVLGSVTGFLSSIKEGLLGDGNKKEGILSKLFSGLFGDDGFFSGILSLFTGESGSFSTLIKSIAGKGGASIFKTLLRDIGIGALIYAGFDGKFDKFFSDVTGDAYNDKSASDDTTYTVTTTDGKTVEATKDKDGNYVDSSGNIIQVKSVESAAQGNYSFSDRLKENTARGALTGTGSVVSKLAGKTTVGKAVAKTVTTAVDAIGDAAKVASFTDDILNGVIKFTSKLKGIPALKFMADKLDDMGRALAKKMEKTLMSQTAKNISSFASNAVIWIKIAYIIIDFTSGYEDARTTLGIVSEPTVGQRVLSGLLRAIKNFIPVVGTLIPDSLVIDVFCDYIASALGIDVDELKNAREEAEDIVENYNAANDGTDYSVSDFTKKVMKDYTWTERIGNATKGTFADAKAKVSNFASDIKENGLGGAIQNVGAGLVNGFKDAYDANGGGISGVLSGIGDTMQQMLPGVFGEILGKAGQILSLSLQGKIKEIWTTSLDDFSGGGEDIEGTDLKTAVPGIFSQIVGRIAFIPTQIPATLIGLISLGLHKVGEALKPVFEKIKGFATGLMEVSTGIDKYVLSGDIKGLWTDEDNVANEDSEDNPLGGFGKVLANIRRVTMTPIVAISWVGHKIAEGVATIFNKVKTSVTTVFDSFKTGCEMLAIKGGTFSFSEFLDVSEITDDPENPVGGFTKVAARMARLSSLPAMIMWRVGKAIGDGVKKVFNTVKDSVVNIVHDKIDLLKITAQGDIDKLWKEDLSDNDEGNPIGGFLKVINFGQKLALTPATAISWVGHKAWEGIKTGFNAAKNTVLNLGQDYITLAQKAGKGDVSGMWSQDLTENDEGNPIGGFAKVINIIQKVAMTPTAAICWVGKKIGEGFTAIKDKVVTAYREIATNNATIQGYAKSGDIGSIWSNEIQDDEGNPLGGIFKAVNFVQKMSATPIGVFHMVGNKVKEFFHTEAVSGDVTTFGTALNTMKQYADDGDLGGIWDTEAEFNEENPLHTFFSIGITINKIFQSIAGIINKIMGPIKTAVDAVKDTVGGVVDKVKNTASNAWNGLTGWIAGSGSGLPSGGSTGTISTVRNVVSNVTSNVKSAVSNVVGKTENSSNPLISAIVGKVKNNLVSKGIIDEDTDLSDVINSLGTGANESTITQAIMQKATEIAKTNNENTKTAVSNIISSVKNKASKTSSAYKDAALNIVDKVKSRLVSAGIIDEDTDVAAMIGNVTSKMSENDIISKIQTKIVNAATSKSKITASTVDGIVSRIRKKINSSNGTSNEDISISIPANASSTVMDKIKSLFGVDTSGGKSGISGGDSGFISQYDPRYQQYNVSGQQFAAKGCGPAVASMAASALGKNLPVGDAVAASNGYQNAGGVTLDYFQNALGSRGINTQIISGGSSADMYSRIASGQKMILLGQDASNTSKDNSPFGPNNHYVLATGLDRNGNVIVNDPESNGPRVYSPQILANAKYGIAGSNSGLKPINNIIYATYAGGGSPADWNLGSWSVPSEADLNAFIKAYSPSSPFVGNAAVFIEAGKQSGLDPRYILAHAAVESGWGKSNYAINRNNYFGIGAFDTNPDNAYSFGSGTDNGLATGIIEGAKWISKNYYNGKYKQTTVNKMRYNNGVHEYCTSTTWTTTIASIMGDSRMPANTKISFDETPSSVVPTNLTVESVNSSVNTSSTSPTSIQNTASNAVGTAKNSILNIISTISSAFSNAFSGNSNSSSSSSSSISGYDGTFSGASGQVDSSTDTSASTGGVSKPHNSGKGTAQSFVDIAKSQLGVIEGKDNITDYGKFMGMDGQAWCASFVSWCMDQAFNSDSASVKKALRGGTSASVNTFYNQFKNAGALKGKNEAQMGDIAIYKNAGASHTGIVEAVDTDGKVHTIEGNTSGDNSYNRNGGMVARKSFYPSQKKQLTGFGRPDWGTASAAGSGLVSYEDLARVSGGSSGLLIKSRAGSASHRGITIRDPKSGRLVPVKISGGASDIGSITTSMLNNVSSSAMSQAKAGTVSSDLVAQLLQAITTLLNNIADNTAPVDKIYKVLLAYINAGGNTSGGGSAMEKVTVKKNNTTSQSASSSEVDSNISTLVGVLAELAKG